MRLFSNDKKSDQNLLTKKGVALIMASLGAQCLSQRTTHIMNAQFFNEQEGVAQAAAVARAFLAFSALDTTSTYY